ncbi:peptidoglycan recognition protein family protein [Chondrinema litorale]|uniref:peptidoglycan recognition protein family protein n=1 Tax=Chondrinema litorale TaxID=2994555 RepID=UPI002543A478|nr:peptidoglycan recognition family protein [Chondrinema litorale]UZR93664.1 peptidoglycan recognition family protein [Chondrinema litorale]
MKILFSVYILFFISSFNLSAQIKIIDKPITWNDKRKDLSLEYLQQRHSLDLDSPYINPKMVVVHYTVIPTLEGTMRAFMNPELPGAREAIKGASSLNVSSQFVIDQDGTIYRLLPETAFARHVIGLNYCAIGIENVGGTEEVPLTKKQLKSNVKLIKYLKKKYDIEYLIGHSEYTDFAGSTLWKEVDDNYRTTKSDPGEDFMKGIRKKVKKLDFKSKP